MKRLAGRTRGHSLTELIVVIGMVSFLLSTATELVHKVLRCSADLRRDAHLQRVCRSAAVRFREDARAATSIEPVTPAADQMETLRFQMRSQEHVDYGVRSQRLERTVIRDGNRVHFDEFNFGPNAKIKLLHTAVDGQLRLCVWRLVGTRPSATNQRAVDRQCFLDVQASAGRLHQPQRSGLMEDRELP